MDAKLLNDIKRITKMNSINEDLHISSNVVDIKNRINNLINNLFVIKFGYINGILDYGCYHNILVSIKDLEQIVILLNNEQQRNIMHTKEALEYKDDSIQYKKYKDITQTNIIDNQKLNSKIEQIINKRKKYYIDAFGYFDTKEKADNIIKKEFNDVSIYIDLLRKINSIQYEYIDNYDILINIFQNIIYELIQLVIACMKAEESKIEKGIDVNYNEWYFIIMDFVNSKSLYPDKIESLQESILNLNSIINMEKDIKLLCNMNTYMQDEAEGIVAGSIDKFINIVNKFIEYDIKLGYGKIDMNNSKQSIFRIEDSVYNIPFILTGPSTWEAREMLTKNPILIKESKK